ncbi:nuclear transport factor 2 family protein [Micromonospora sp. NPDC051925]|uniref:nuclear transport factor 2 family protein n=1 Tax=Micromonospora sp. NPDC051925 TaxID=3364288 RepID=UPI0037C60018
MNDVDRGEGTRIPPEELPAAITAYLAAHRTHETAVAITSYAADAVVVDEGRTHRGLDEIRSWLEGTASEYRYTTELTSATSVDDTHFVVTQHLEGDFPGGVVDLHYRFTTSGALITHLTIEP